MEPQFDTTTIDTDRLAELPEYKTPPTYHLQESPGNGCFGDPPGFPTYFTQCIFTARGNTPPWRVGRPTMVLLGRVVESYRHEGLKASQARHDALMVNLWNPLPIEHPRTRAWIMSLYTHFRNCYADDSKPVSDSGHVVIFPVPYYNDQDAEMIARVTAIAIPENHMAVRQIRKFYPLYQPEPYWIAHSPHHIGDWWKRYAENFTSDNCPGSYGYPHQDSHCQMCGRRDGKLVSA